MTLTLALSLALAQELVAKTQTGQTSTVEIESTVELEIKTENRDKEKSEEKTSSITRETFTQTVADAASGRARRLKIKAEKSTLEKSGDKIPFTGQQATAREGKAFEVVTGDGRHAVTLDGGAAAPDGSNHVGSWESFADLLKADAAVGETWERDAKDLSWLHIGGKANGFKDKSKVSCTLVSKDAGVAKISFTGKNLSAEVGEGNTFTMNFSGEMTFDTTMGRPTGLTLTGDFTYHKKLTYDEVHLEGNNIPVTRRVHVGDVDVKSTAWTVTIKFTN